jgi:hypothetical protein
VTKKTKRCRFCHVKQGQQHKYRCAYVQSPSLYQNTIAFIDMPDTSSSHGPSDSGSCSTDSGSASCGSSC